MKIVLYCYILFVVLNAPLGDNMLVGGICSEVDEVLHLCLLRLHIFWVYYSLNSLHTEKEFTFLATLSSSLYHKMVVNIWDVIVNRISFEEQHCQGF